MLWIGISFKADPDLDPNPDPGLMTKNLKTLQLKSNFD